ncbi:MAG: BspA family leucine-rich repeat surface protein [Prevotella sp.]
MTKKKNLTAFMIAIIVMLFSLPANAQGTVGYVVWDGTNTLTFKGGTSVPKGDRFYALNTGIDEPAWISDVASSCTNVVFDASFNDVRPTSCFQWFLGFSKLSTIKDIRYLNTDNVKTMQAMFDGCSGLTTLDVSKFNTANVTHMIFMFQNCSGLTSLNLSNFNTANVEFMYYMFYGCKRLTSLDLSSFNTDKVTDMERMFYGCSGLTSLDLSSFNTAKVTEMDYMFNGCSSLTSLDLSSFNTATVTDMYSMFDGCSDLTTIYVSDDFTTDEVIYSINMFTGCESLKGKASYSKDNTDIEMANYNTGYFTKSKLTPYVKWNGDTKVLTFKVANTKEAGSGVYDLNEGASAPGWLGDVSSDCEKVVFTPSFKQAKPTSCSRWFQGFSNLSTIEGIGYLNTAAVTTMESMFNNCSGLTSLDLSSFNTAEVTDMFYMFGGCSGLKTIYVSDAFTTNKVRSDGGMFASCVRLKGATSYNSNNTGIEMAKYTTGYFKTYFTLGEKKVELCGENPLTTESLNLSGDYDFTPKFEAFTAKSATYTRDLSTSGSTWFSLCLPFAYTPDNFTAYQLKGATGDAVEIEQITGAIAAGTPVLFKFKDGVDKKDKKINITATDAQIVAPVDGTTVSGPNGCQLYGTYQEKTFSQQDNNTFIIYKDRLMNPAKMLKNENVTKVGVKPFRAYMTMTSSAGAKSFSIGSGDEGTTAIDLLNSVATDDAEYYDINGRRIDAPAKGVNIVRRGNKTMKLIIK